MFDQFKEKIHSVQQDLNAGLKTLSEKAREVGRSKKLPGELHVLEGKQANLLAVKPERVDAGADILNRFQQAWTQLHINIEYSAEKAMKVDKTIQEITDDHEKQMVAWKQLRIQLQDIPDIATQIQTLAVALGKLEADFEEIESMLDSLEDTCEEEELINNKKMQITELMKYKEQKAKERQVRSGRLQDEYNQKFRRVEEKEDAKKKERQKAFQDVFAADMDHYRTHGKMTRLVSQTSKELTSSLEDLEIIIDEDDQQALDDFLGPGDDGQPREAVAMATWEVEEEEDEEQEEEEDTETEEEERRDVTLFTEGDTSEKDGVAIETKEYDKRDLKEKDGGKESVQATNTLATSLDAAACQDTPSTPLKGDAKDDDDDDDDDDDNFGTPDEEADEIEAPKT